MKRTAIILLLFFLLGSLTYAQKKPMEKQGNKIVLVIHGGAGVITKANLTEERERVYREILKEALQKGYEILNAGGSALDAVQAVVVFMEDSPLFNAGKGSVFSSKGHVEMDASIMDGKNHQAGAVAGITITKNPVIAARMVLEKSPHVLIAGDGADDFARKNDLELVDEQYFFTERRWKQLQKAKEKDTIELDHNIPIEEKGKDNKSGSLEFNDDKYGTVGAVALDKYGNLAAATSTGGTTNKKWGRIGDSPIIGAGNYADNASCAVSCTGTGEYFIRYAVAHDVAARMKYKNISLKEAAEEIIHKTLIDAGGDGGLIAVDKEGNIAMEFNTEGMYRGFIENDGIPKVYIFK